MANASSKTKKKKILLGQMVASGVLYVCCRNLHEGLQFKNKKKLRSYKLLMSQLFLFANFFPFEMKLCSTRLLISLLFCFNLEIVDRNINQSFGTSINYFMYVYFGRKRSSSNKSHSTLGILLLLREGVSQSWLVQIWTADYE